MCLCGMLLGPAHHKLTNRLRPLSHESSQAVQAYSKDRSILHKVEELFAKCDEDNMERFTTQHVCCT